MSAQDPAQSKAVGVAVMEAEHKLMHDLLHQLRDALAGGRREAVAELLGRFQDVARLHFMEEQSLMRLHAYPGYAAHEQEHDELIAELAEFSRRVTGGELSDAAEVAASLERWLVTHMETTDAVLEEYLESEGIRTPSGG